MAMSSVKRHVVYTYQVLTHILTALYSSFGQDKDKEEIVINTQEDEETPPIQGTSKQALIVD